MKKLLTVGLISAALFATEAQAKVPDVEVVKRAVNSAFCGGKFKTCWRGSQAFVVAGCETGYTYNKYAKNGQYLGIFQMGSGERRRYGFAYSFFAQATAAKKYFDYAEHIYSDGGWHPWECAYRMGIL